MSHSKERTDKNCLNCHTPVHGRYCHVCGQENIEPQENFWHLVNHFFADITHFDGKFFSTLKYLLFKPGFLAGEYLKGRRASYLHPVRMYVFTSAFFFLIFFSFYQKENELVQINNNNKPISANIINSLQKERQKKADILAKAGNDSIKNILIHKIALLDSDIQTLQKDSTAINQLRSRKINEDILFENAGKAYESAEQYDSVQNTLPKSKRDGFFEYRTKRQLMHLKEKYHTSNEIFKAIAEKFKHLIPQMLFVGLPLFALVLFVLYARHNEYYYVNHVIFLIYLFCATFIIILSGLWLRSLLGLVHFGKSNAGALVGFFFTLLILYYWYKSMKLFYKQSRIKTVLKYVTFVFTNMILMSIIFVVFLLFSAMML
ncbi:MAG: DUF3667 domain-containing protein [Sphingobacteriia bacterium]|nr:DUF3667 domain-containing protein [Sphingobacteriia bacterium]